MRRNFRLYSDTANAWLYWPPNPAKMKGDSSCLFFSLISLSPQDAKDHGRIAFLPVRALKYQPITQKLRERWR